MFGLVFRMIAVHFSIGLESVFLLRPVRTELTFTPNHASDSLFSVIYLVIIIAEVDRAPGFHCFFENCCILLNSVYSRKTASLVEYY